MRKRNWKRIIAIFILAAVALSLIAAVPQAARAGFGDFDSQSDYGGSRKRDSGGDSGGIDLGTVLRIGSFLGRLVGIKSPYVSIALTLVVFILIRFAISALKKGARDSEHEGIGEDGGDQPDSLSLLQSEDPAFDSGELIRRVKALFEKMQSCWEDGNIEPLRKDFMPDTWTRFNTQLQNKKMTGETSHVRDIQFEEVALKSYAADSEHQKLRIRIAAAYNVWTTNREGACIQGSEKTRKRFEFVWTMVRPLGAQTGGTGGSDTTHCPNCGAEVDLEAFAECPFCHTPIMKVSPDWVISEIDAVSQETIHD